MLKRRQHFGKLRGRFLLLAAPLLLASCSAERSAPPAPTRPATDAAAVDWPHLRGSRCDGIADALGLIESWPDSGPPILWTRELGQGNSGFIVVGGKAYTQMQNLSGQYLLCLDAETGAEIWQRRVDWPWRPKGLIQDHMPPRPTLMAKSISPLPAVWLAASKRRVGKSCGRSTR